MADKYANQSVEELMKEVKGRGLQVRKGQKKEDLIKILWGNDQAQESPLQVSPVTTRDFQEQPSFPPLELEAQEAQCQHKECKLRLELKLHQLKFEAKQRQCKHKAREAQLKHKHEANKPWLKHEHELELTQRWQIAGILNDPPQQVPAAPPTE